MTSKTTNRFSPEVRARAAGPRLYLAHLVYAAGLRRYLRAGHDNRPALRDDVAY